MKILTVIGARPQFIKAAVVSRAINMSPNIHEIIVHTGQHFDENMSKIFFDELEILTPKYNLGIGGGTHGENTGRMLEAIEKVLFDEAPDYVLVYGDTDSTLAATISACKLNIPVAHVEAGLRSYNRKMPEEINRVLTDHASAVLFTPTKKASETLINEGIKPEMVINVGDVMFDAALHYGKLSEDSVSILDKLNLKSKAYVLATVHRQENVDDAHTLSNIIKGLGLSNKNIILPLHPRTKKKLQEFGIGLPKTIRVIDPLGYLGMAQLEKHAEIIVTDSGGIQKEAFFHKVPCVTLRNETEWIELVEFGFNKLSGSDVNEISLALNSISNSKLDWDNPMYGNGNAADKIVSYFMGFN
jgi:UDP-GlcNAc3NAcA epimerase